MRKGFIVFIYVLIISCSSNNAGTIPNSVLPKEKMAKVMVDIHLLEAALNISTFNSNTVPSKATAPTAVDVFKKNNITKKQYEESFYFYTQHPELLTEVYNLVLNDLSTMQAKVVNKK
jgi:hypothetical protein